LFPNPLATVIVPLATSDLDRSQLESVFVAIGGNSVTDDDAGIANRPRDRQDFETAPRKIAERVEVVHFVDIKKSVFGIVGGSRRTDDHAGGIRAITGDAVRGAGVTTQCSQISDGECWLAADTNESASENGDDCKTDLSLHVHGSVVVVAILRLAKKAFADKHQYEKSRASRN
jgi:hypothetical protein